MAKMPASSKPSTGAPPAVTTPPLRPACLNPATRSRAVMPGPAEPANAAASRMFMNSSDRWPRTGTMRTTLAGEMAIAKIDLPPAWAMSGSSAAVGRFASHSTASAAATASRTLERRIWRGKARS